MVLPIWVSLSLCVCRDQNEIIDFKYNGIDDDYDFPIQILILGSYITLSTTIHHKNVGVLWIQENTELGGTITESYCTMDSITLDCNNFEPQPTYPLEGDSGLTTFEEGCLSELGRRPKEYTCNFDVHEPYVKPETNETVVAPVPSPPAVCGTPRILD